MQTDDVPKSLSTHWPTEELATAADEGEGREQLATMVGESTKMPGIMVGSGATNAMPESKAQRPAASEEQAMCSEMLLDMVGRSVRPSSPREHHQLWRKRMRSRRLSVKKHDLKPSASSANGGTKL